ncbi:MAG: phytoene/squalene synthase family protein [Patescibacteria group bacterium]|nr:phytoene/squalene synthase family protein [Patescibacteria group bacterium]
MEQYSHAAQLAAKLITTQYSSSFSLASRAFPAGMRKHIYNLYGLVRVADEIVDSYTGSDKLKQLHELEASVYEAIKRGYSSNVIVHAFQITAVHYDIDKTLIRPFFESMRTDITKQKYTQKEYERYIYGSAEVVGLMCLKIFATSEEEYDLLRPGAEALGAAFQKVNFLRDIAHDHSQLERFYFPHATYETFDDVAKQAVVTDIYADFRTAKPAIDQLPKSARGPVMAAYRNFYTLLQRLDRASVAQLKERRVRIHDGLKLAILIGTVMQHKSGLAGRS